ncbi:MAG: ROK family protein [Chlamydiota bacterium]
MFLVGDIGGTHTRLAFVKEETLEVVEVADFYNEEENVFLDILKKFCQKRKFRAACFGVAGVVENQICHMTNIPWTIDAKELSAEMQTSVFLVNDMEAFANGIQTLSPNDILNIQEGEKKKGNVVILSPGTGLGIGSLVYDGHKWIPFASEGGHADAATQTEEEKEVFSFFQRKYGHVSYERILSGKGLLDLCTFFGEKRNNPILINPRKIVENPNAKEAVETFLALYGAKAGNAALDFLSISGVYLGGLLTRNLFEKGKNDKNWKEIFLRSFWNKGRFSSFMKTIPIRVVLSEHVILLGAALYIQGKKKEFSFP